MGHGTAGRGNAPPQLDDLLAYLSAHPNAVGLSIGDNGIDWGPVPPVLRPNLASYPVRFDGDGDGSGTPLDMLSAKDGRQAMGAYARCWQRGYAQCTITPEGDDPTALTMWDMRAEVGTIIAVLVPGVVLEADHADHEVSPQPRLLVHTANEHGVTLTVDDATPLLLGRSTDEWIGRPRVEFVHPEDHPDSVLMWVEMLERPDGVSRRRTRYRHKDGSYIWFEITTTNLLDRFGHVRCELLDITDSMAAFDALHQREQLLRFLTDSMPHGLLHMSVEGEVLFANQQLAVIAGRDGDPKDFLSQIAPEVRRKLYRAFGEAIAGHDIDVEGPIRRPDGSERYCHTRVRSLGSPEAGILVTIEDITERWRLQRELEAQASTDSLTGLLNRRATLEMLEEVLAEAAWSGSTTSVAFLDLNGFKQVNDDFGHPIGDRVLSILGASIRAVLRPDDGVGRLGGDEFLVIWRNTNAADAAALAERVREAVAQEISIDGRSVWCTTSCGLATAVGASLDVDGLIEAADRDMYRDKRTREPQAVQPLEIANDPYLDAIQSSLSTRPT